MTINYHLIHMHVGMNSTNVTNISGWCDVAIVRVRMGETWEYLRF